MSSARTSFTSVMPSRASKLCASTPATIIQPRSSRTRSRRCSCTLDEILLHVSRGVRWDSDHVVVLSDELEAIAQELVRGDYLDRVHIGLDFFDASINRVAAWVIGTRAMLKALLLALLEPTETLRQLEADGDTTARLALLEELKTLPFGAVWDHYCRVARRTRRPRLAGGGQGLRTRRALEARLVDDRGIASCRRCWS